MLALNGSASVANFYGLWWIPDYGVDKYDIGTGFGHFGIAVENVSEKMEKSGMAQ